MGYHKIPQPLLHSDVRRTFGVAAATSAGTIGPAGTYGLATTSTTAPVVYTLAAPKGGERLELAVDTIASSSAAPFHVNANSGAVFAGSSLDMVSLSTTGAAVTLVALNSTRWYIVADRGATLSTST